MYTFSKVHHLLQSGSLKRKNIGSSEVFLEAGTGKEDIVGSRKGITSQNSSVPFDTSVT